MPTYSHSRLSAFENCPRSYYYRYVARVSVEKEDTIEAFLGTTVHAALEKLYRDRMCGRFMSVDELVEFYGDLWSKGWNDAIVIVRPEYGPEEHRHVGEECLRMYHARWAPFDQATTLSLEDRVVLDLDGTGRYMMQGYIDRLSKRADETIEVHDYKTNIRLPSQDEKDEDRQLALYEIAVRQRWPNVSAVELVWHFLRHDQVIWSSRTPAELTQLRDRTIALIDDIETCREEADFPPTESALCDWCPYQSVCPVRKHRFATQELPAARFRDEPGVALVNRHSALKARIADLNREVAQLDAERHEVIDALIAYARREGVTAVYGTTHEARVKERPAIVLPRKTHEPEEYAELERLLRESPVWTSVSGLDAHALRRLWQERPPELSDIVNLLGRFVREEQQTQLSFRKRTGSEETPPA